MPDTSQLQEAIAAIKAGDKAKGRKLLSLFLQNNPNHENALLWMSATTKDPEEKRKYFKWVLEINPDNEKAKQALAKLDDTDAPSLQEMTGQPSKIRRLSTSQTPVPVTVVQPKKKSKTPSLLIFIIIACGLCIGIGSLGDRNQRAASPRAERATPAPTPTLEHEAYLTEVGNGMLNITTAIEDLAQASEDAKTEVDEETVIKLATSLAIIRESHETLKGTVPPVKYSTFHVALVKATSNCNTATERYAHAIDNVDMDEYQVAVDLLINCRADMEQLATEWQEMTEQG